jgi:RNA polymerase sigma-70 factor (ECF subfamily)
VDRLTAHLLAARDGDDAALTAAIRTAQPDVRRFLRLLVDDADLEDVVQDTFIRAYQSLGRFRAESSGRTWLLAIARRAAADATRRRVRQRRARERAERLAADATAPDPSDEHALRDLVAGLDRERREAFVLTQVVGCPYLEAAEICGVPVGTIRSRVARAREELLQQVHAARSA